MSSPIATQHLRELASNKSKAYELLMALEQNPDADESCFAGLASAVDRVVLEEISLDAAAIEDLARYLSAPAADLGSTLAVLAVALSEADPDRSSVRLLLTRFPHWLNRASDAARPHFLAILPNIAAHLKDLGSNGVESLIDCFNGCASSEDADLIARCIVRYQETEGPMIAAAAELGSLFLRTDARACIERMLIAVPGEAMLDSKEARALLPAIAALKSAAGGDLVWSATAAVCIAVARHNHSSALNLARQLAGVAASVPADARIVYLKAFESIVDEAGISLVGYSTKQLPALFQKAGADRASQFVAEGTAIARRYGKVAAEDFFDQKTAASKEASPAK